MGGNEATMKTLVFACFVLCVGALVSGCGSDSTTSTTETTTGGSAGSGGQGGGENGGSGGMGGNAGDAPNDETSNDSDTGADEPESSYLFQCIFPNTAVNNETWEQEYCVYRKCTPERGCETNLPNGKCESDDDCIDSTCDIGWNGHAPVICDVTQMCSPDDPWDLDHVADPCP